MTFKLPNFLNDGHLNALRSTMDAPLSSSFVTEKRVKLIELPEIKRLREDGIDVAFDDIRVLEDGTLSYKDKRVLLYIRDVNSSQPTPKFHLVFCRTLNTMQRNKRWRRYVVANRDDGLFQVNFIDSGAKPQFVHLDVCQNCLGHLGWSGFNSSWPADQKAEAVRSFTLTDFFEQFPRDLFGVKPEFTAETAPLNDYTDDWPDVSEAAKRSKEYKCEACTAQLKGLDSKYLHTHHRNGQKNDNSPDNLEVLCIACHAEEPLHAHLKAYPAYLEFMQRGK